MIHRLEPSAKSAESKVELTSGEVTLTWSQSTSTFDPRRVSPPWRLLHYDRRYPPRKPILSFVIVLYLLLLLYYIPCIAVFLYPANPVVVHLPEPRHCWQRWA